LNKPDRIVQEEPFRRLLGEAFNEQAKVLSGRKYAEAHLISFIRFMGFSSF